MTYIDLADAIQERIVSRWPERTFYRDFCPVDFERPSFFLAVTEAAMEPANAGLTHWTVTMQLEIFGARDVYDEAALEELVAEQREILRLFGSCCVRAAGRAVTVLPKAEGQEAGSAFISFTAEWFSAMEREPGPAAVPADSYALHVAVEASRG